MLDWTDRHCRYLHRLLAPKALLYSEMVTTGALKFGDQSRHLDFSELEHPVVLQLGGEDPTDLAFAAQLAQKWGYDEVNLNCGCPSDRVQNGAFGACLMARPQRVAEAVKAMQDAVTIPVTVKHRIGLDYNESYSFVRDFVGILYEAGCRIFIVHARNAVLKGLSPKENREIPPLRYEVVQKLKNDFPDTTIIVNGGLDSLEKVQSVTNSDLCSLDGVMIGRKAYQDPLFLQQLHREFWPSYDLSSLDEVLVLMMHYIECQNKEGVPTRTITRHMLGLMNGRPGARYWRRQLSDPQRLNGAKASLIEDVWNEMQQKKVLE